MRRRVEAPKRDGWPVIGAGEPLDQCGRDVRRLGGRDDDRPRLAPFAPSLPDFRDDIGWTHQKRHHRRQLLALYGVSFEDGHAGSGWVVRRGHWGCLGIRWWNRP